VQDFEEFVVARFGALARTGYLLVGDWNLAQDLVQEALTATASRWESVCRRGDPEPYVRQAMYHRSIDWWRKRRVPETPLGSPTPPESAARSPDEEEEKSLRRLMLATALSRLTPRQRAVLVLRYYDDLSEAETAVMLGCSVNTVKSQARHALGRLREVAPDLLGEFEPSSEVKSS
jgi:RNA polymerase sigma-70 factor (sigma-E family)